MKKYFDALLERSGFVAGSADFDERADLKRFHWRKKYVRIF